MTVLLLAGTGEARSLAKTLSQSRHSVIATLSGATEQPLAMAVPVVRGGFGGANGFVEFVRKHEITAVIDATHPFASQITKRTYEVCSGLELPLIRLERESWAPQEGDKWRHFKSTYEAAEACPEGARVFLATGRKTLPEFGAMKGRVVFARQIDTPTSENVFDDGQILQGTPPFSVDSEIELFDRLRIDILISKNSGGEQGNAKLVAARALGLEVFMVARPVLPRGMRTARTVDEVCEWLDEIEAA